MEDEPLYKTLHERKPLSSVSSAYQVRVHSPTK